MARSKQATPVRREISSEYFGRHSSPQSGKTSPGANALSNGAATPGIAAGLEVDKKDAGIVQLMIAVGGIYASLCALPARLSYLEFLGG